MSKQRSLGRPSLSSYNGCMPVPHEIHGQKYISLGSYRRSGAVVRTPVWFGEEADKLYVMTRSDSGKYKRIRNNATIRVAPCSIRGKITGPDFAARCRILPQSDWDLPRHAVRHKYWMARIPFLWSKKNIYLEITFP